MLDPEKSPQLKLAALAVTVVAIALLAGNTAGWKAQTDFSELGAYRRLWSDEAAAITAYLDTRFGPAAPETLHGDAVEAYRPLLLERIERGGLRPWQFWRTIGPRAFLNARAPHAAGAYDDPGRAMLLAAGFRVLGGISPFLILWLALLVCAPVLAWTVYEFFAAGHARAGTVFILCLVCSPYFVETLALPRYAVGFYLAALLALVALSAYALLGTPTPRGLLARTLAAGAWLALCALCRSSALLLLPGFAFALWMGLRRLPAGPPRRKPLLAAALAVCLTAPILIARQPAHHGLWSALWEGLGDFDREKGHAWSDPVAEEVSRSAGAGPLWTPPSEALFRRLVLQSIRQDPLWYGEILIKRLAATVTQWKLWPWRLSDGAAVQPRTSWNEGYIDKYYGYTTTVDHIGLGAWRFELPIALLLAPALILGVIAVREPHDEDGRRRRACLLVMATVALATLPVPVLISTAAAQETQAFALTYALAFAFLVEELWRQRRSLLALPSLRR